MRLLLVLWGKNFATTLVSLVLWIGLGHYVGSMVAATREPAAAAFVARGGSVGTSSFERYRETRDGAIAFCAWCGLLTAQVVFVAHLFGSGPDVRPGGFPIKEL